MVPLLLDIHPHFSGDALAVRFLDTYGRSYLIHQDSECWVILPAGWNNQQCVAAPSLESLVREVINRGYTVINNTRFQQLPQQ